MSCHVLAEPCPQRISSNVSFTWSLQERFYFGDTVLPLFESGIPLVKRKLSSLSDADNITIAYPDEGSWKRFHYQFGEYPEVGLQLSPLQISGGGSAAFTYMMCQNSSMQSPSDTASADMGTTATATTGC